MTSHPVTQGSRDRHATHNHITKSQKNGFTSRHPHLVKEESLTKQVRQHFCDRFRHRLVEDNLKKRFVSNKDLGHVWSRRDGNRYG